MLKHPWPYFFVEYMNVSEYKNFSYIIIYTNTKNIYKNIICTTPKKKTNASKFEEHRSGKKGFEDSFKYYSCTCLQKARSKRS